LSSPKVRSDRYKQVYKIQKWLDSAQTILKAATVKENSLLKLHKKIPEAGYSPEIIIYPKPKHQ